jgi:hypothetical protein
VKKIILLAPTFFLAVCQALAQPQVVDTTHSVLVDKLALDLDGSRHAYHPNNEGIDHNANGGISQAEATQNRFPKTGNRGYGIAKKLSADKTHFIGYVQPNGYFVSQTPVYNKNRAEGDPDRYADAETIPYIAISPAWKKKGLKSCDFVYVVNLDNGKESAAIFADYRGNDKEVELSLALAGALGIPVSTKMGTSYDGSKSVKRYVGIKNNRLKIYYFKGSGDGNGKTPEQIEAMGKKLMGKS